MAGDLWLSKLRMMDTSREVVNLASVSGHGLQTMGIVTLDILVGDQRSNHEFIVTNHLNADVLLGY